MEPATTIYFHARRVAKRRGLSYLGYGSVIWKFFATVWHIGGVHVGIERFRSSPFFHRIIRGSYKHFFFQQPEVTTAL